MHGPSTSGRPSRRVLILTSIVSPYRIPSFAALADMQGIDLTVGFLRFGDPRRPWDRAGEDLPFRHVILGDRGAPTAGALRAIARYRPGVVIIGGWDQPAYLAVSAVRPLSRFRLVVWSESTDADARPGSVWRETLKRWVVRRADAVMVPGRAAAAYARSLGATGLHTAVNAVDNDLFAAARTPADPREPPQVVYVGRLAPEKALDVLLRAWRRVQQELEAELVLIGSGPEEEDLRRQAAELGLRGLTSIPFIQQRELVGWYGRAHVLVLPSRSEPWGFVINEAMAAGLPVVATSAAGAAPDLVEEGVTGHVVAPNDSDALAAALTALLRDPGRRAAMGAAARERVAAFTPGAWAHAVARMVHEL